MSRNTLILLLFFCPLLAHCAPGGGSVMQSSTEFRLRSLEAKYLELEEKQAALEILATDRLQELQEALSASRQEVASLRARLGEAPATSGVGTTPVPPAPQPPPAPPKKPQPKSPQKTTATPPKKPSTSPAAVKKQPASTTSAAVAPGVSGVALYEQALQRIQAGKPGEAVGLLEKFVAENPSASLTPDAYFWLGESHFFLGDYDRAILAYKDVAGRFPSHAKAPQAMLKIGYAYEKLNDPNNARFYLQALLDEYPGSESANLAKEKIAQLGK